MSTASMVMVAGKAGEGLPCACTAAAYDEWWCSHLAMRTHAFRDTPGRGHLRPFKPVRASPLLCFTLLHLPTELLCAPASKRTDSF